MAVTTTSPVLWTGLLAPPFAWAVDLLTRYALVKRSCGYHSTVALQLVSLGAFVVVVFGAFASWQAFRGSEAAGVGRFLATFALLASALFAVAIVAGAIPQWMFDACQ
jgi:hypothetical protein